MSVFVLFRFFLPELLFWLGFHGGDGENEEETKKEPGPRKTSRFLGNKCLPSTLHVNNP